MRSKRTPTILSIISQFNQTIPTHWCLAVYLRIGIYNGEMGFNRLLGLNGWSDLDDLSRQTSYKRLKFKIFVS